MPLSAPLSDPLPAEPPAATAVVCWQAADCARQANAFELAGLLQDSRARTLALADAFASALGPTMAVPYAPTLNPPLWELGHIGWFQEFWIARNPQCHLGVLADPDGIRNASVLAQADAWYNSSTVAHASRWHLPLPDRAATAQYLQQTLDLTLQRLRHVAAMDNAADDAALYFYRLTLFHEDMHAEAAVYMAQALGISVPSLPGTATQGMGISMGDSRQPVQPCSLPASNWQLGLQAHTTGFAFDNELGAHTVQMAAYTIDDQPVNWRRYLERFANLPLDADANAAHLQWPRYVRKKNAVWEHCVFGQWQMLDLNTPACHLSYAEVQAWCQWAGRQLPTEAQWERAAMTRPDFQWGQVWEWTASTFAPYPDFAAHPYRDYSAPWFGSRPVLRGASHATVGRMAHPRYRNYFTPERTDIYAGFRTCVVG
jgi:gamma-glutamyl hercynylcysteine S-oxide synthase